MRYRKSKNSNKGFTLIELAVVLVVVGIILGGFIGTLTSRINVTKKSDALSDLEDIKQSMMAYSFVNGYLPCPDCAVVAGDCTAALVGDGISDYNVGNARCSLNEAVGHVPWVTLGLGRGDSWGNHYRYAVQNEYADESVVFTLSSSAGIASIKEPDFAADNTGATAHSLAENIVAIIFSHGSNGYGAISEDNLARTAIPAANVDELENTDNDAEYYMRPETSAETTIAGKEFDDIVIWISEFELKAKMVEAGKLP